MAVRPSRISSPERFGENSQLGEHLAEPGWHCHHDHFKDSNPNIEWQATLDQAEKIGLGTRQYELKRIK